MTNTLILHATTTKHSWWGGPKRYVRIVIHDTIEQARAAADVYHPFQDHSEMGACFHPPPIKHVYLKEYKQYVKVESNHFAGVMRLAREGFTPEILLHECVHLAATIYRMDKADNLALGMGCDEEEENFAYIYGHMTDQVLGVVTPEVMKWEG